MAREHARAFRAVPGAVLAGIHSRTRTRAEVLARELGISAVCDSVAELHEKTGADLVVVTVNELSMNAVCKACFAFPWTALLEKPAGYDLADAEEICRAARGREKRVYVALNRRFYSSTRAAAARLSQLSGERFIVVQDQQDQAAALAAGQPEPVVRNWMFANSIHVIDCFRLFGRGAVAAVEPVIEWNPASPGVVVAKLAFSSGDTGLYQGIWNGPGPWAVTIYNQAERWELRPLEQAALQLRGERRLQPVAGHPWDQEFKPGFRLQAEAAVAAARGEASESIAIEDALESMRLVAAIFAPRQGVNRVTGR